MASLTQRIHNKFNWAVRRYIQRDPVTVNVETWYRVSPTQELLFQHHLPKNPVVFDVGGFTGEWAAPIHARYGGTLHVFEPLPQYVAALKKRFAKSRGVNIHPFGLAAANGQAQLALLGQGSTAYQAVKGGQQVTIQLRSVNETIAKLAPKGVHLMAINAEGAEYDLLESLLKSKNIRKIHTLLIQFHPLVPGYRARYRAIDAGLAKTHSLVFRVPFVWEKWVSKA